MLNQGYDISPSLWLCQRQILSFFMKVLTALEAYSAAYIHRTS